MALGLNEIKERAAKFANEWESTTNEDADAKPFLVEFFLIVRNTRLGCLQKIKKRPERAK